MSSRVNSAEYQPFAFAGIDPVQKIISKNPAALTIDMLAAVQGGNIDLLGSILERGIAIDTPLDEKGNSALHISIEMNNTKLTNYLIVKSANVNAVNNLRQTPLHISAHILNKEAIQLLIEAHAEVHVFDLDGMTALMISTTRKSNELTQILSQAELSKLKNMLSCEIQSELALGDLNLCEKDHRVSLNNYQKALDTAQTETNWVGIIYSLLKLGDYYLLLIKDPRVACNFYTTARVLAKQRQLNFFSEEWFRNKQYGVERSFIQHVIGFPVLPIIQYDSYIDTLHQARRRLETDLDQAQTSPHALVLNYSQTMRFLVSRLFEDCIQILGQPPCKYTVLGLGSMSRDEMGPFSDVEYGVIIERNTELIRKYFNQLFCLLQLKMISIGETEFFILMQGADSVIKNGFSLDTGGNTPINKEELLGTIDQLVAQQLEGRFKGDLILSNILKNTCLICGDRALFENYETRVKQQLSQLSRADRPLREEQALYLIEGDLREFKPKTGNTKFEEFFNVKKELYRFVNNFVTYLSIYYEIQPKNSWDRLNKLIEDDHLSEKMGEKIKYLLNFAVRMRVKVQLFYGCEKEDIYYSSHGMPGLYETNSSEYESINTSMKLLLALYEEIENFVKSNGQVDFRKKDLKENERKNVLNKTLPPHVINRRMSEKELKALGALIPQEEKKRMSALEEKIELVRKMAQENHPETSRALVEACTDIGRQLLEKDEDQEALKYLLFALFASHNTDAATKWDPKVGETCFFMGDLFKKQKNYVVALAYHLKALDIWVENGEAFNLKIGLSYIEIGDLFSDQSKLEEALKFYFLALSTFETTHCPPKTRQITLGQASLKIAGMLSRQEKPENAESYFLRGIILLEQADAKEHYSMAANYINFGLCLHKQKKYRLALKYFFKSLAICEKFSAGMITNCCLTIADSYNTLEQFDEAKKYCSRAIAISDQIHTKQSLPSIMSRDALRAVLTKQGLHEKSMSLLNEEIIILERMLGADHPVTLRYYKMRNNSRDHLILNLHSKEAPEPSQKSGLSLDLILLYSNLIEKFANNCPQLKVPVRSLTAAFPECRRILPLMKNIGMNDDIRFVVEKALISSLITTSGLKIQREGSICILVDPCILRIYLRTGTEAEIMQLLEYYDKNHEGLIKNTEINIAINGFTIIDFDVNFLEKKVINDLDFIRKPENLTPNLAEYLENIRDQIMPMTKNLDSVHIFHK